MGRNAEAYVDDIVVKTRESHTFIEDLEETFANLRRVNIKLNPAKCAFGVPSGKLLGFLMSHCGIEANPDKVKAIEEKCVHRAIARRCNASQDAWQPWGASSRGVGRKLGPSSSS
jgi:hypothetical protein